MGGGIDAPLSCNVVIAGEQTSFSYPEVKFNHFPVAAVAVLSRRVGTRTALKLLTSGVELSARSSKRQVRSMPPSRRPRARIGC